MRKTFGIVLGGILLYGLVIVAVSATPQPTPVPITITITGDNATDGVDTPWFEVSYELRQDTTIQWINSIPTGCNILFKGGTPLVDSNGHPVHNIQVDAKMGQASAESPQYHIDVPAPPPGWTDKTKVYKFYKYDLKCGNTTWDPGGGIRP
jgi:hypothetical protein